MITYSDYIHTEPCTILVQFCFYLIKCYRTDTPDFHEILLVKMNQVSDI